MRLSCSENYKTQSRNTEKLKIKKKYVPYLFLLPSALFMILVFLYPLCLTFKYSFFKMSMLNPNSEFVGLKNFSYLFTNSDFSRSAGRTLMWTICSVSIKLSIGLLLALLLSKKIRGIKIYRTLLLIPWAMPHAVSSIIWAWIYDGNYGYLNYFFMKFGITSQKISWLGERKLAFISTVINDAWAGIPFVTLVFLAGLQAIPESLYEAAEVDGANRVNKFFSITLPQLKNIILVTSTLTFIWTFNSFNIIWILTKGGPVDATETLIIKIYRQAFGKFDMGLSSAMSVIVFLILITLSIIYWKITVTDEE
ncbi:carbohydrate ABC transporter permease [Oceanirhabdus sp. W0125-5]|uniref:carbohydrate ABC transporter permease n=1 Tax=Oceanirhabdus sp. W0125-5 TaxID=2999116 RepID=UPI0022F30C15|nr:sugar ABC transporter permease [Oceanirhabdus sp. W0125-5]WBW96251.1 sugar ABC transporter permease [Oceanirhabdus sp. W0125-5]